uniref:Uncharacterized protein n=1 Tax=Anguilla anguilla TaxID=7936 RepID=A0A0E9WRA0_ANGAN
MGKNRAATEETKVSENRERHRFRRNRVLCRFSSLPHRRHVSSLLSRRPAKDLSLAFRHLNRKTIPPPQKKSSVEDL